MNTKCAPGFITRWFPDGPTPDALARAPLVDFNRRRGSQQKLVAIYPKEGTFYSDNPFVVLDAPWVSASERKGAGLFQRFLASEVTPELAARSGFRPADPQKKPVAPIDESHGADPSQPERVLGLPEPRVLDRIRAVWRKDRKPANVMLVVDVSGSMADEDRLKRAKQGLEVFMDEVAPTDRLGLISFAEQIDTLVPVHDQFREGEPELRATMQSLVAGGTTAVYDATAEALRSLRKLGDPSRINAVVVLTDGGDTDSTITDDEVVDLVSHRDESGPPVRIFTIAYSPDAERAETVLKRIAAGSGGQAYTGTTSNIDDVYRQISSFF